MPKPHDLCECFKKGYKPGCPCHWASCRSRCAGWKRFNGRRQPTCYDGKGCSWCWEKYNARYHLERKGVYVCPVWCWPQTTFRFNSSLMWGASPYKEYAVGPVRIRRYIGKSPTEF